MVAQEFWIDLLKQLEKKFPTKALIAEALGLKYVTVAHWYDGSSYPSFNTTLKILDVLDLEIRAVKDNG